MAISHKPGVSNWNNGRHKNTYTIVQDVKYNQPNIVSLPKVEEQPKVELQSKVEEQPQVEPQSKLIEETKPIKPKSNEPKTGI